MRLLRSQGVLHSIFGVDRPIIGMVHSWPLPGSPRFKHHDLESVVDFGVAEALRLKEGGVDGLLLENAGDVPFVKESDIGFETAASMAMLGLRIRQETGLPLGVITVANAAKVAIAVAQAAGASFVRVNQWVNAYVANEGFIEGAAGTALRYRSWIGADTVRIFADVHVKHGSHAITADREISEQAIDAAFFEADVLIATGTRTGSETTVGEVSEIRSRVNNPVVVGSGFSLANCRALLAVADGAIIGSSVKDNGRMHGGQVDVIKVRALMDVVNEVRAQDPQPA